MSLVDSNFFEFMGESSEMTEKVHSLADSIYKEFELLIKSYGENVVKNLMPLVVSILENMDQISREKQQTEVDVELLKEDNEQLLVQFERERRLRRNTEQKYMVCEDNMEEERRDSQTKISSLESIVRMFEIKLKNCQDQILRMDDRETEMKKEFSKLHERYTDLLKSHMDLRDRSKPTSFSDKPENAAYSTQVSRQPSELPTPTTDPSLTFESALDADMMSQSSGQSSPKLASRKNHSQSLSNEILSSNERRRLLQIDDNLRNSLIGDLPKMSNVEEDDNFEEQIKNQNYNESINGEDSPSISDQNPDEDSEFRGMRKEVEILIAENDELLATKNALNIVKDDLISRVDELTGERELLSNEIMMLQMNLERSEVKVRELEVEIKKLKEEDGQKSKEEELEMDMAQRKRFTRIEMARVLMERNQYKERLMELQEAVRFAEMMRANRQHPERVEKKGTLWNFFNGLFGNSSPNNNSAKRNTLPNISYSTPRSANTPPRMKTTEATPESAEEIRKSVGVDETRQQAYGWSLPTKFPNPETGLSYKPIVPVPVFCRPIEGSKINDKLVCACGVNMYGGRTKDGGSVFGASVFYNSDSIHSSTPPRNEIEKLDQELKISSEEMNSDKVSGSCPFVWLCVGDVAMGFDMIIIDASNPSRVIDKFQVSQSNVLCMASLPGAADGDEILNENVSIKDDFVKLVDCADECPSDDLGFKVVPPALQCSSRQPTIWIGTQSGTLLVHSSISNWKRCLHKVKLKDQILSISHTRNSVLLSLANGTVAIFKRRQDGQWCMKQYYEVRLSELNQSVRCSIVVANKCVWCSIHNFVFVINISKPAIMDSLEVHPRRESQVRQMAWVGEGVWCSFRMDSTLRLFHAFTRQHLQDVDIEPHVTKLLGHNTVGFSFVRITSLLVNCNHLWVGTTNGVILTIPLSETNNTGVLSSHAFIGHKSTPSNTSSHKPGSVVRVYPSDGPGENKLVAADTPPGGSVRVFSDDKKGDSVTPGSFVPYCNIVGTQLSFHGHRDAVKFIIAMQDTSENVVAKPSSELGESKKISEGPLNNKKFWIMSGGDGYIDFRTGDTVLEAVKNDQSHIIGWQILFN